MSEFEKKCDTAPFWFVKVIHIIGTKSKYFMILK